MTDTKHNIVGLYGEPVYVGGPAPNPEVLEVLETLLAEAKAGRLLSFGYAALGINNALSVDVAGQFHPVTMRGAIVMLEDHVRNLQFDELELLMPEPPMGA